MTATVPPLRLPTLAEVRDRRALPGPSDELAWSDPGLVFALAGLPVDTTPRTTDDLLATYDTADPAELAASFALAEDVALAERLAEVNR